MDTIQLRALLDKRDAIDKEIAEIVNGASTRKPQKCSNCQQEGHSARTCPTKAT
jgi:hypothetical protein